MANYLLDGYLPVSPVFLLLANLCFEKYFVNQDWRESYEARLQPEA